MSMLERLLEAERAAEELSDAHVERLRDGLQRAIDVGAGLGEGPSGSDGGPVDAGSGAPAGVSEAASAAGSSAALAPWLKSVLLVALGAGAGSLATYALVGTPRQTEAPAVQEDVPVPNLPVDAAVRDAAAATEAEEEHPPPRLAETPPRTAMNEAPAPRLADERALIDGARQALVRGEADAALRTLRRHRRRYRRGEMGEERDALEVVATAQAGRVADAEQLGRRFRARYPRSLLAATVRAALANARARASSHEEGVDE